MDDHPETPTGEVSARMTAPDGAVMVTIVGELDLALRPAFEEAVAATTGDVVVDMGQVTFLDSAGITVLVEARRAALERGSTMRVAPASDVVMRILEITGLLDAFGLENAERRRSAS